MSNFIQEYNNKPIGSHGKNRPVVLVHRLSKYNNLRGYSVNGLQGVKAGLAELDHLSDVVHKAPLSQWLVEWLEE
jgi:hypothetical protein